MTEARFLIKPTRSLLHATLIKRPSREEDCTEAYEMHSYIFLDVRSYLKRYSKILFEKDLVLGMLQEVPVFGMEQN